MNENQIKCCYCGLNIATTKDHIPPKAIFNKPRPSDLITVPCCLDCNNHASKYDERFKAYLGMHVASKRGEAERLFKQGTLPTIRHNNSLRKKIIDSLKPVKLFSRNGLYLGKRKGVLWDSEAHDTVIERLVRGLYFHHYKAIIGDNAKVDVHWYREQPESTLDLYKNSVGNGAFTYLYNRAEDSIFNSVWLFQFYDGHWAGGFTILDKKI